MKNVIDQMDSIKANSVSEKEFKNTWGISLDEHMERMIEHVHETDARVKAERQNKKND